MISTTGSLLTERNIGLDISQVGNVHDQLSNIVTGLNPEDMKIYVLTKSGSVYTYPIKLEKPFDPKSILRSEEDEGNSTSSNSNRTEESQADSASEVKNKITREERWALQNAALHQPVKYEYIFDEANDSKIDIDREISTQFDMPSTGNHTYSNLIGFFARGKHYFVVVQDERNIVIINEATNFIQIVELQPGIRSIQRYSAYIMV